MSSPSTITMLRPRRPRSALSSRSLQYESSDSSTDAARWNCPDAVLVDDSQSSSSSSSYSDSDDEECVISEQQYGGTVPQPQRRHSYMLEPREKITVITPLCRVSNHREKHIAQRALIIRTTMTLLTVAAIAISYYTSNPSTTMTLRSQSTPTTTNVKSSMQIRKRQLVEVAAVPKVSQIVVSTATNSSRRRHRRGGSKSHASSSSNTAFTTVSIAQKAKLHRTAMNLLVDRYGIGPHLVEFQIRTWPQQQQPGDHTTKGVDDVVARSSYFTIEMAPVHMMPISVHAFLQQVTNGLWDNTSFYFNTEHLLAAHPISSSSSSMQQPQNMLTTTSSRNAVSSYTEYNSAYPHLPYTLGLVGTGPDFYINKATNTHPDSCFANVVIGRATIDSVFLLRGHDRTPHRIRPVEIISARIIQRNNLTPKAMDEYVRTTIPP